jgi:signal transduction histidine kinase
VAERGSGRGREGRRLGAAVVRIATGGLIAALAVVLVGMAAERVRMGTSDTAAIGRVEQEVRAEVDRIAASLVRLGASLVEPARASTTAASDPDAARPLFEAAAAALPAGEASSFAVTVYGPAGAPIAWAGRPSDELRRDRVTGPASLFVAPGPLGPRLVYVLPVFAEDADGHRVGSIVAERVLSMAPVGRTTDSFTLPTSLVPVSLRARYEGAGDSPSPGVILISSPTGEPLLEARVSSEDLSRSRQAERRTLAALILIVLAVTVLLTAVPLADWRRTGTRPVLATAGLAGIVVTSRLLLAAAVPPAAASGHPLFSPSLYSSPLFGPLLGSPVDFLLTALAFAVLVAIAGDGLEGWRLARRTTARAEWEDDFPWGSFALSQLLAGGALLFILIVYRGFLRETFAATTLDLLRFSILPWEPARLALAVGLLFFHVGTLWLGVLVLRAAGARWRARRGFLRFRFLQVSLWAAPVAAGLIVAVARGGLGTAVGPTAVAAFFCVAVAASATRLSRLYRRASQAARLVALLAALVVPALVMYPSVFELGDMARRRVVETQFAPQAMEQREEVQLRVRRSLEQIDRLSYLPELLAVAEPPVIGPPPTDIAYLIWSQTDLATYRVTSAIELYSADGSLVSRFALNLPEYTSATQTEKAAGCDWVLFELVSPFGAEERRLLHAGRGVCADGEEAPPSRDSVQGRMTGSVVIHVMLDYNSLPFISSQSPYFELFRTGGAAEGERAASRDVEFAVYGWSRSPIYTSGADVWPLTEEVFARVYASREPFWTRLAKGDRRYDVYFLNDRGAIYALGTPLIPPIGHFVNLAEIVTLGGIIYGAILIAAAILALIAGRPVLSGTSLLGEVRASFYRKLFLAFVAASIIPVLTLAMVARAYFTSRLHSDVESAAARTTTVAKRVIEDYLTQQQRGAEGAIGIDDDVMIWISRVINQDVNIFEGPRLVATSERDLFASGLLPTRTPADVYRTVALQGRQSYIGEETVGDFRYMVAAAPIRGRDPQAILTVPLTLRQQEIRREIDALDRRIMLAAVVFILLGAGIGYSMAQRIADPVNRLTRATRRIARGELDARIAVTSSDELRRLVEAFNSMAAELERQGLQLERTHRLEAWADMARQVAHEIKNPLTPIQLSAEHLQRVHADQGAPLTPVLQECIGTILTQVRLLRQIATEFSSFASSPTPRPGRTDVGELIQEVIGPYTAGLSDRIRITVEVPAALPMVFADRTLVGRALTNVIENALHAMPGSGALSISAAADAAATWVGITVADTGVGMDREAQKRIFEPYFSTKAIGTGLGLTIARRNIELSGGTIEVASEKGKGTVVTVALPSAHPPAGDVSSPLPQPAPPIRQDGAHAPNRGA